MATNRKCWRCLWSCTGRERQVQCLTVLQRAMWNSHAFEQRPSRLLFDPPARVACLGCAWLRCVECVYMWKLRAWYLTYWAWRWRAALHILTCKHANVQARWISPNVNYFRMVTFLKNSYWPTYTNRQRESSNPLSVFTFCFFFRIYGLDLGLLPAFSQWHLKGESELITSVVPCAC